MQRKEKKQKPQPAVCGSLSSAAAALLAPIVCWQFFFFSLVLQRPSERARCDLNVDVGARNLCAVRLVLATGKWLLFVRLRRVYYLFFPLLDRVLARVARCPTDDIFRGDAYNASVCLIGEDRLLQISGGFQRRPFIGFSNMRSGRCPPC